MVESYKIQSKITTAIGGICTIISVLGIDQLTQIFPGYGQYIPAIVALATWYLSQTTENTRVERAEQLAILNYQEQQAENNNPPEENIAELKQEYTTNDEGA